MEPAWDAGQICFFPAPSPKSFCLFGRQSIGIDVQQWELTFAHLA
jgi:hypothetical protein